MKCGMHGLIFLTVQLISVFPRKTRGKIVAPHGSRMIYIVKLARKKKRSYKKAKSSDNADLWSKYMSQEHKQQKEMTKKNINSFGTT